MSSRRCRGGTDEDRMGSSRWVAAFMMDKAGGVQGQSVRPGKYARVERERRVLLAAPPPPSAVTPTQMLSDRYRARTCVRLRRAEWRNGGCELKLTQKVPVARPGA